MIALGNIKPPMLAEGRARLASLDCLLGEKLMPINLALSYALDKVLTLAIYTAIDEDGEPAVAA